METRALQRFWERVSGNMDWEVAEGRAGKTDEGEEEICFNQCNQTVTDLHQSHREIKAGMKKLMTFFLNNLWH